jgi:hypothetical protein
MQQLIINERYRILKGQSKKDNQKKLATYGTQDKEKQKHNTTKRSWQHMVHKTKKNKTKTI